MKDHRLIDERSLAFDRLIAAKLRSQPSLVEKARGNLARWLETCSAGAKPALLEWHACSPVPSMNFSRSCQRPTSAPPGFGNRAPSAASSAKASASASSANSKDVNRPQLEHIIHAAAGNADTTEIVIIGSQAILGTIPTRPMNCSSPWKPMSSRATVRLPRLARREN